jgi:hypothetical protein
MTFRRENLFKRKIFDVIQIELILFFPEIVIFILTDLIPAFPETIMFILINVYSQLT